MIKHTIRSIISCFFNLENIILNELDRENLVVIKKWIFPFDKDFKIDYDENKAKVHNEKTKYTYKNGINHISQSVRAYVTIARIYSNDDLQ